MHNQAAAVRAPVPPAALDVLDKVVQQHRPCAGWVIIAQVLVHSAAEVKHLMEAAGMNAAAQ